MSDHPVVFEVDGVVGADPEEVWPLLAEARRRPGVGEVTVDEETGEVIVHGGWWYEGRDRVTRHEQGTHIRHRVHNVATGPGRLVADLFQVRSHRRHAGADFAFLVGSLGQRLGCETWVPAPEQDDEET
ncbi:hypothetical protein [Salsipaludibacter albus]|uniref:hypothetical protein n=1 Tax=Salsipaludibacter albus TaxID=2849650 RepID=UPI001EE40833|nr:hypothetical protein [Salsipaludibacter albus]MBY5163890.1 hypothetical protein [Salsipaludibacter albus]